jgi:hypothetical protein
MQDLPSKPNRNETFAFVITIRALAHTQSTTTNATLTLAMPTISEDVAAILYPPASLTALSPDPAGAFIFRLDAETGGQYWIDQSTNLVGWNLFARVTNTPGALLLTNSTVATNNREFYRARQQ